MLNGLLIGDGKGAELNLIPDACDNTPSCVDYPDDPIFHAHRKSAWPDDQRRYPVIGVINNANSGVNLQAFSVQYQLSNEVLWLLICRQRPILPGEVDLNIWQGFYCIGPPHRS